MCIVKYLLLLLILNFPQHSQGLEKKRILACAVPLFVCVKIIIVVFIFL